MTVETKGLSSARQVEALADQLAVCADQLHARLKAEALAIGALPDSPARASRRAALEALFDDELALRQHAGSLYADAATILVSGLGKPQQQVIALTKAAAEKIRKITLIGEAAGLVAALLALAGSIASAKPNAIVAALDAIGVQLKAVKAALPANS